MTIGGLLRRLGASGRASGRDAEQPSPAIRALVAEQLAPWTAGETTFAESLALFCEKPSPHRFVVDVGGRRARLRARMKTAPHPNDAAYRDRIDKYVRLIEEALRADRLDVQGALLFDVDDMATGMEGVPVVGYQRKASEQTILFPDIDFLQFKYYEGKGPAPDRKPFAAKANRASFAGATTGFPYVHTLNNMLTSPRIDAALFFRDRPDVDFRLSRLVQTDGPETEAAIRALGVVRPETPFEDAYEGKFIISMDGNGATCSRVAMALRSNCVLLKYVSPSRLHYFSAMTPWLHYVPIDSHEDVLRVLARERRTPGYFEFVAEAGRAFYDRLLTREAIVGYTAALVDGYCATFRL